MFDAIAALRTCDIELDYVADNAWLPYGLKSGRGNRGARAGVARARRRAVGAGRCRRRLQYRITIALEPVRAALSMPVVGVVPPIKPAAALTKTGVIGLLATPATVRRAYTD